MDPAAEYARLRELVDRALEGCFRDDCAQAELLEAMRYSLLAGGKRIRPVLLLAFCRMSGGRAEDAQHTFWTRRNAWECLGCR